MLGAAREPERYYSLKGDLWNLIGIWVLDLGLFGSFCTEKQRGKKLIGPSGRLLTQWPTS
jgi:hypothetical protein